MLLLAATGASAQITITDKAITRKTGQLELDIHYPQTGRAEMDRIFSRVAQEYAAEIEPNIEDPLNLAGDPAKGPNTGWMGYKIRRNDAQMFSVQISTGTYYAGRAHGMPNMVSFSFLMPEGAQVFLPELVDGQAGLNRVRELVVAELTKQLGPGDHWTRPRAHAGFLQDFAWLPDALELTYPPYSVAAYAAGTRIVRIPLSQLAGVVRPDPRAPAPSFSCTKARSPIEKTICSDATPARQDRQLAERYSLKLEFTDGRNDRRSSESYRQAMQKRYEATVASQRAWLLQRNKDCASGDKGCLVRAYEERQIALYRGP
jgi:uncharacterized protein YecT (DUF1311 family)